MTGVTEQIQVQYQNKTGNWTTVMVVQNLSANILIAMQSVARTHPDSRVRAIDQAGRVVDLL
ncbi:hypothetical protein [Pararhodobacter sp.]|uniref:hypothetical protein n=1 Tax=Pararhodobacter sp. TaxID=2127056 RepID=UPI002AFDCCFD|nr:hypothetical protein [Pararhodobacter sp.]